MGKNVAPTKDELVTAKQGEIENLKKAIKSYKSSPKWKAKKGPLEKRLKALEAELADLEASK